VVALQIERLPELRQGGTLVVPQVDWSCSAAFEPIGATTLTSTSLVAAGATNENTPSRAPAAHIKA